MLLEVQCEVSTVSDDLGCHVISGVGPLCFLKSKVNAAIYQEILEHLHLHLHLVIWQTLLSKATYNWGIHKAIHLEEAIRQRKCS